jgi:hypothetical protein
MANAERELKLKDDTVVWREIDGEIIAIDIAASEYLSTNGTGSLLWAMLASGSDREALTDALVERFGVDRARAADDVDSFLRSLRERSFLTQ